MRRSTAAAVGTLTGAALIAGVRLSVSVPEQPAATPPAVDLAGSGAAASAEPTPSKSAKAAKEKKENPDAERTEEAPPPDSGLRDGTYRGAGAKNPYGTIQVSIKVTGGKIVAADASYPTANNSAIINPPAKLKEATLRAQSADVDAGSGATFTSEAYVRSLQAALDQAGG
jgi:uncharacterized protein with FMN-binding domain